MVAVSENASSDGFINVPLVMGDFYNGAIFAVRSLIVCLLCLCFGSQETSLVFYLPISLKIHEQCCFIPLSGNDFSSQLPAQVPIKSEFLKQ